MKRKVFDICLNVLVLAIMIFGFSAVLSSDSYALRSNYKTANVKFDMVLEQTANSYIRIGDLTPMAFIDFDKESFELAAGRLPSNKYEVLMSDIQARRNNYNIGDITRSTSFKQDLSVVGIFNTGYDLEDNSMIAEMVSYDYFVALYASVRDLNLFPKQLPMFLA